MFHKAGSSTLDRFQSVQNQQPIFEISNSETRRDDIQGLRALAVTIVVLFHAGLPVSGGFVGVDIFFAISGYVITLLLMRELQSTGSINLPRFFFRRFKRLSPALALVVACTVTASIFFMSPLGAEVTTTAKIGLGALAMAANVVIARNTGGYFDVAAANTPLLHTWSLSVEEQFYLAFPLLLLIVYRVCQKTTRHTTWLNLFVFIFFLLSFTAVMVPSLGIHRMPPRLDALMGFYSPLARAWEFAGGVLLATSQNKIRLPRKNIKLVLDVLAIVMIFGSCFLISGSTQWPGPATIVPVFATLLLLLPAANHERSNVVGNFLRSRPLVALGDLSYSWYLWHWPAIVFTSIVLGNNWVFLTTSAVLSMIPAALSYHFLEQPLRHITFNTISSIAKVVTLTIAIPVMLSMLVVFANNNNYWSNDIRNYKLSMDEQHLGKAAGCGAGFVPTSQSDSTCLWSFGKPEHPLLYLIGDSNADHFSEAVLYAGEQAKRDVRIFTKGGCAFIGDSWSDRNDLEQEKCLRYVNTTVDFLKKSRRGIVIIGISDSIWRAGNAAVGPTRLQESTDRIFTTAYLQSDLNETILDIKKAGHQVLLLQPIPKFVTLENKLLFEPAKCPTIRALVNKCPEVVSLTIDDQNLLQREAREAIKKAAIHTNSELFDMREPFCPGEICTNIQNGQTLFRDAGHLTVSAVDRVKSPLLQKLLSMQ